MNCVWTAGHFVPAVTKVDSPCCSQKRNQQSACFKEQHTGAGLVYLAETVMELDVNMSWVISLRGRTSICFFSDGCRPAWFGAVLCFGVWLELPAFFFISTLKPHVGAAKQSICKCFEMFCLQTLHCAVRRLVCVPPHCYLCFVFVLYEVFYSTLINSLGTSGSQLLETLGFAKYCLLFFNSRGRS